MALVCDIKSEMTENAETKDSDLEDGEIEDDEDEEMPQDETGPPGKESPTQGLPIPAGVLENFLSPHADKDKTKRHNLDRKSDKHLTEAEKCVRMLHKMEREAREKRERERRREQVQDDWAGNIEKAIASVLKKDKRSGSEEEVEEEDKKRSRKRKKKERERKKKHRKIESPPKSEELDEDEMLNIRGASPEGVRSQHETSPNGDNEHGYESYDSEYDSEPYNHRPKPRNFERERKRDRNRNKEARRDRKNFREKNNRKKEEQNRPQMQDSGNICMFYMQGKCHKGDECPYSHDVLPPMKLELCKFYLMDCCAKRDKCLYMHSEFPCKYYHTGLKCFAKDNCKFAHETAPKEILGEFPRLSRDGAQQMVNQTQKQLEVQYGIKPNAGAQAQIEKSSIPSLFDITVPMPPELMQTISQNETSETPDPPTKHLQPHAVQTEQTTQKPNKPEKKVRQTRWNDEPAVSVAPDLTINPMGPVFNQLNVQDQQKLHEYQMNFLMKGFYSEQDQDMRVSMNGDVDMRTLSQVIQKSEPFNVAEPYQPETSSISDPVNKDVDNRSFSDGDAPLQINEDASSNTSKNKEDTPAANETALSSHSGSGDATENSLTIDEQPSDENAPDFPSNLPKKQRELFLRIQAQQKDNTPEKKEEEEASMLKDDDWYSSDDDNDPLSKMVIHLEDEENSIQEEEEEESKEDKTSSVDEVEKKILSPPDYNVIDKLGDLSKIDISEEVTKLLTSIKSTTTSVPVTSATTSSVGDPRKNRDPRQAKILETESSASSSTVPVQTKLMSPPITSKIPERRLSQTRITIYEQGIINMEEKLSIMGDKALLEAANVSTKGDVDLRTLDSLSQDLDMRKNYGDTDLRLVAGRQDVDLRQLGLPFKAIQNYTPASEIDASIGSHTPMPYKVHVVDIPRPDYTGLKLSPQDAQVLADPRLRKIFRVPSIDEKESPASPKQSPSPPKPARQDPRRRNTHPDPPEGAQGIVANIPQNYSQQLQLLQNSAFYQSLTSNQKVMLNQELASKGDTSATNDPILNGVLSSLGLIAPLATNNLAMNILASVNSLVPNMQRMNPMMQANIPNMVPSMGGNMPNMPNHSMNQMGPNMQAIPPGMMNMGPNVGPGLLGAAPVMNMGQQQNEFPINFDPRNGGLLGPAPFQNYPENQNFQNYNEEFYPNNEENNCNFPGGNNNFNPRNERSGNFRERDNSRGRRGGRNWNRNNRNFNKNNSRNNRNNRSYTPP